MVCSLPFLRDNWVDADDGARYLRVYQRSLTLVLSFDTHGNCAGGTLSFLGYSRQ